MSRAACLVLSSAFVSVVSGSRLLVEDARLAIDNHNAGNGWNHGVEATHNAQEITDDHVTSLLSALAEETEARAPLFGRHSTTSALLRRRYSSPGSHQASGSRSNHHSPSHYSGSSNGASHPSGTSSKGSSSGQSSSKSVSSSKSSKSGSSDDSRRRWGRRRESSSSSADDRRRWRPQAKGRVTYEGAGPNEAELADRSAPHRRRALVKSKNAIKKVVGKEPAPPATTTIKQLNVLTYNICWGCTCAYLGDRTAMQNDLKKVCMKKFRPVGYSREITECSLHMARGIKQFSDAVGGYDLIAFQEAMQPQGYDPLMHMLGGDSPYVVVQLPRLPLLSIYKKTVFHKPDVITGGGFYSERPAFLILVFDPQRLIFINFHNDHNPNNGFEMKLSRALEQDAFRVAARKTYRVILTGDFNDAKSKLVNMKIKLPWLATPMGLRQTAPSCCTSLVNVSLRGVGDYILDSEKEVVNRVPKDYNRALAQSDHRPVEATL